MFASVRVLSTEKKTTDNELNADGNADAMGDANSVNDEIQDETKAALTKRCALLKC